MLTVLPQKNKNRETKNCLIGVELSCKLTISLKNHSVVFVLMKLNK